MAQICQFLKVFQKMVFYHYTLCADIFVQSFILLLIVWLWNIHPKGQQLNCDIKNGFINMHFHPPPPPQIYVRQYSWGSIYFSTCFLLKYCLSVCWILIYNQRLHSGVFHRYFSVLYCHLYWVIFSLPFIRIWYLSLVTFI